MGVSTASIILVGGLGYSWGIRGVFVEYSWDIRMYRVCVGYVSGMYREYVEGDGEGGIWGGRGEYIYSLDKKY